MPNNCFSTQDFEEICTIYSVSKPVENFMGSDTNDTIDRLFKRAESYIKSSDWLAHKEAIVNPKNENDSKCFLYAIIIALRFNKIRKKYFPNI